MGGISSWQDAIEFILAGSSAIQIGTHNFIDPTISVKVVDGIREYLDKNNIGSVKELVGALQIN
jgi:dihydroorotate dehydrogenase (NAD+) catalytic subunit